MGHYIVCVVILGHFISFYGLFYFISNFMDNSKTQCNALQNTGKTPVKNPYRNNNAVHYSTFWVWNDCRSDVNEKRVLLVKALRSRSNWILRLNSRTVMWSEQEFDLRLTSRDSSRSLIMKSERDCEISYGSKYKHSITERHVSSFRLMQSKYSKYTLNCLFHCILYICICRFQFQSICLQLYSSLYSYFIHTDLYSMVKMFVFCLLTVFSDSWSDKNRNVKN